MDTMEISVNHLAYYIERVRIFVEGAKKSLTFPHISNELEDVLVRITTEEPLFLKSPKFNRNVNEEAEKLISALNVRVDIKLMHYYEDGRHGPNTLVFKKIEVITSKPPEPLRKPIEAQITTMASPPDGSPVDTMFKTSCLNATTTFIKDDSQLTMKYPEMAKDQTDFIMNMLLPGIKGKTEEKTDVGYGFRSMYAPLWESMKVFSLKYDFKIHYVDSKDDTTKKCIVLQKILKTKPPEKMDVEAQGSPTKKCVVVEKNKTMSPEKMDVVPESPSKSLTAISSTSTSSLNSVASKYSERSPAIRVVIIQQKKKQMIKLIQSLDISIRSNQLTDKFLNDALQRISTLLRCENEASIVFENMLPVQITFLLNVDRLSRDRNADMLFSAECQKYLLDIGHYIVNKDVRFTTKFVRGSKNKKNKNGVRDVMVAKMAMLPKKSGKHIKKYTPVSEDLMVEYSGNKSLMEHHEYKLSVLQSKEKENQDVNGKNKQDLNIKDVNGKNKQDLNVKNVNGKNKQDLNVKDVNGKKNEQNLNVKDLNGKKNEQNLNVKDVNGKKNEQDLKINDINGKRNEQNLNVKDVNGKKNEHINNKSLKNQFADDDSQEARYLVTPLSKDQQERLINLKAIIDKVIFSTGNESILNILRDFSAFLKESGKPVDVLILKKTSDYEAAFIRSLPVFGNYEEAYSLFSKECQALLAEIKRNLMYHQLKFEWSVDKCDGKTVQFTIKKKPAITKKQEASPAIQKPVAEKDPKTSVFVQKPVEKKQEPVPIAKKPATSKTQRSRRTRSLSGSRKKALQGQVGRKLDRGISGSRISQSHAKLIEGLAQPVQSDKAMRMMQSMGWKGGALGPRGNGITEPIMPKIDQPKRAGFGHVPSPSKPKPVKPNPKPTKPVLCEDKALVAKTPQLRADVFPFGVLSPTQLLPSLVPPGILTTGHSTVMKKVELNDKFHYIVLRGIFQLVYTNIAAVEFFYRPPEQGTLLRKVYNFVNHITKCFNGGKVPGLMDAAQNELVKNTLAAFRNYPELTLTIEARTENILVYKWPKVTNEKDKTFDFNIPTVQNNIEERKTIACIDLTGPFIKRFDRGVKKEKIQKDNTLTVDKVPPNNKDKKNIPEGNKIQNDKQNTHQKETEIATYIILDSEVEDIDDDSTEIVTNNNIVNVESKTIDDPVENQIDNITICIDTDESDAEVEIVTTYKIYEQDKRTEIDATNLKNQIITRDNVEIDKPNNTKLAKTSVGIESGELTQTEIFAKDNKKNTDKENTGVKNDDMDICNIISSIKIDSQRDKPKETDVPEPTDSENSSLKNYEDCIISIDNTSIATVEIDSDEEKLLTDQEPENKLDLKPNLENIKFQNAIDALENLADYVLNATNIRNESKDISLGKRQSVESPGIEHKKKKLMADFKKLCIVHKNSQLKIDHEKAREIQASILNAIDYTKELPLLNCQGIQNGGLVYSCQNENTLFFMEDLIKTLHDLRIVYEFDVKGSCHKMAFRINSFLDEDVSDVLDRLERYNSGLDSSKWRIVKKEKHSDFIVIYIEVDNDSFNYIRDVNFCMYAGNDCVHFSFVWD